MATEKRRKRQEKIPDHLVKLPEVCKHGNKFRSFVAVPPGSLVWDPGCKDPKTLKLRPHRAPKAEKPARKGSK